MHETRIPNEPSTSSLPAADDRADTPRTLLYLDDLSVGQQFETASHQLDAAQIVAFASAWDPQPFHLDEAAARDSLFAGLAASGWHTAAITMRLQVQSGPPLAGGLIGASGTIVWPQPTRASDSLRVHSTILDIVPSRSRPERGMVSLRTDTRNQHGRTLQLFTVALVVPRRG